jgi:arginyl-tRNA synthetase
MKDFSVICKRCHNLSLSDIMPVMKQQILQQILDAVKALNLETTDQDLKKIQIEYPEPTLGDYSSNVALILSKVAKTNPKDLAEQIIGKLDKSGFESVEVAGPGFINFKLRNETVLEMLSEDQKPQKISSEKILLEYFQPNIAKPLHVGHLRTAILGDAIKRSLIYLGHGVESDTHMGDWGTQFGFLIHAYKKYGHEINIDADPVNELNKLYIRINQEAEDDPSVREQAKQEFVKLEQGDKENREIWKKFVDWSVQKFLQINDLMDILPFDHHWPESFYEDKMPAVLDKLKKQNLIKESQGAQIVDLEEQKLGVAIIVKSDGGTTYLLRDLATFIFAKQEGFKKHFYVVDNRQSLHYKQLFAILKLMGEMSEEEGLHIDYGFISFKGQALSTRKGNMVTADEVLRTTEEKVAKIINEKNPELSNKEEAIKSISKGALKYYDLSHNRHSDYEFDWDEALDFEGNSGPYLQYTYARLSSILRKVGDASGSPSSELTPTEHQLALETTRLPDIVTDSMREFLPNVTASYLYSLANLANRFYHESPVAAETDESKKAMRIVLIKKVRSVLAQGLDLLGIKTLEEM